MFLERMQQLVEMIDDNKNNISESDYLRICNLMKEIYNTHDDTNVDVNILEDSYELSYRHSEMLKCFINILVISTNISTMVLLYLFMNKLNVCM